MLLKFALVYLKVRTNIVDSFYFVPGHPWKFDAAIRHIPVNNFVIADHLKVSALLISLTRYELI